MKNLAPRLATTLAGLLRRFDWRLIAAVALVAAALAAWTEKPGLRASYISHVGERTVLTQTEAQLEIDKFRAGLVFSYTKIFSVRWRGWVQIDRGGLYRFRVTGTGPARLTVDGREVIAKGVQRRPGRGKTRLEPGLHQLEIDFDQSGGRIFFNIEARPPQGAWGALPARDLFVRPPGPLRRLTRRLLGDLSGVGRNLVGTVFLLFALVVLSWRGTTRSAGQRARPWLAWVEDPRLRRWLPRGGLVLLFVVATWAIFPRTGSPFGFDDVRYLDMAAFNRSITWVLNRYAHVYLLDLFIWVARGDAFLGARVFWAVQFGLIVCAFAVASKTLGPRLQIATFSASLLLLFSQPLYFLRAGASVPDTTVGTLVMVAVALYLHRNHEQKGERFEWQILLIGAITVWAVKSKELGVILLWLAALLPFEDGSLNWRAFIRKARFWLAGVAGGLALLMLFDGIYFKDPLYGLRPSNQQAVSDYNFAQEPEKGREIEGWMDILETGRSQVALDNPRLLYMAMLVVIAAFLASLKRRSIEMRLLHLMPALFVLMLMLLHVRASYVYLVRYLYPVVPLSCFLVAAGFHYLGLDDLRWKVVRSPRFFVPAVLLAFLVLFVAAPYDARLVEASEFLPATYLTSIHWPSLDVFISKVAAPVLVLSLVLALALFQRHRPTRVLLAGALVLLFLGQPLYRTLWELHVYTPWQRAERNLHPLRVFGDRIPDPAGMPLGVSSGLIKQHRMFGSHRTYARITHVYFRQRNFSVSSSVLTTKYEMAFLSKEDYTAYLRLWPKLAESAVFSPGGEIVLVRPIDAGPRPDF